MSRQRIVPDDHHATIEHFLGVLAAIGHELSTVVHVGAHSGEEVDAYVAHGAARIVLIEANPEMCTALEERFAGTGRIEVVHAAATDYNGTAELQLHRNRRGGAESASLLPMQRLSEIVPTLRTEGSVRVPAVTLATLFERLSVEAASVGLLVLDVQGAELHVLRGAGVALRAVQAVLTEVALIELYTGAAREEDVEQMMLAAELQPRDALYYELYEGDHRFPAWGDRLFVRNASVSLPAG